MKYHLGCGTRYFEGYINVDNPPSEHTIAAVKADVYGNLIDVKLESCEEIRSHHVFEHFNYMESIALLVKWTRALNIGGQLIIDIPDMEVLCQELLKSIQANEINRTMKIVRLLYGSHEADWAYHINGWSLKSLSFVLEKLGYQCMASDRYGAKDAVFPNCGMVMLFKKGTDVVALEDKARDLLGFYVDLPAQQDLLDEFKKQFDVLLGRI